MKEITSTEKTTLLPFLLKAGLTRTRAKQLLSFGAVTVNGKAGIRHDHPVARGDKIAWAAEGGGRRRVLPPGFSVLYEDDAILAAEKPAGLLTIATETEKKKTAYFALNEYLRPARQRIFIVHRLDRDASGVIVFAKTERAKRVLQEKWETAEKKYAAVVEGRPENESGSLADYLRQNSIGRVYRTENEWHSKLSRLDYRVLRSHGRYSLVEVTLRTGRKHQIRVQLAEAGWPIAGDATYGAATDPLRRLALHAQKLVITHPSTGKRMTFESATPAEFGKLFK